ncbi:hypothetical protein GGX14DRAFT_573971 [Mycena pura]|uniref:Uncharacterized protein n=1 Tax=Mycena pura TaxID=153505 RepID=A0AAD6Y7F9_9AGAR|nr:hypothetical protein GGX14DRAFT_573971 [Mycena pura]
MLRFFVFIPIDSRGSSAYPAVCACLFVPPAAVTRHPLPAARHPLPAALPAARRRCPPPAACHPPPVARRCLVNLPCGGYASDSVTCAIWLRASALPALPLPACSAACS